jgi:hypothetical protein
MERITTVETAASQYLTDVSSVKADLGITDSSEDAYLVRRVSEASALAARYCGRVFKSEVVTDRFYLDDLMPSLVLARFPVTAISSVTENGDAVASTEYRCDTETGILYRLDTDGNRVQWEADTVVVAYTGGYTTIPADLDGAVIGLIKHMRASRRRDPSVRSVRVPDVIETTFWVKGPGESNLPPDIAGTLDLYRAARL